MYYIYSQRGITVALCDPLSSCSSQVASYRRRAIQQSAKNMMTHAQYYIHYNITTINCTYTYIGGTTIHQHYTYIARQLIPLVHNMYQYYEDLLVKYSRLQYHKYAAPTHKIGRTKISKDKNDERVAVENLLNTKFVCACNRAFVIILIERRYILHCECDEFHYNSVVIYSTY